MLVLKTLPGLRAPAGGRARPRALAGGRRLDRRRRHGVRGVLGPRDAGPRRSDACRGSPSSAQARRRASGTRHELPSGALDLAPDPARPGPGSGRSPRPPPRRAGGHPAPTAPLRSPTTRPARNASPLPTAYGPRCAAGRLPSDHAPSRVARTAPWTPRVTIAFAAPSPRSARAAAAARSRVRALEPGDGLGLRGVDLDEPRVAPPSATASGSPATSTTALRPARCRDACEARVGVDRGTGRQAAGEHDDGLPRVVSRAPPRSAASTRTQSAARKPDACLVELGQAAGRLVEHRQAGPRLAGDLDVVERDPPLGQRLAVPRPGMPTEDRHDLARETEVARGPDDVDGLAARDDGAEHGPMDRAGHERLDGRGLVDRRVERDADDPATAIESPSRPRSRAASPREPAARLASSRVGWPSVPPTAAGRERPAGDARGGARRRAADRPATPRGTPRRTSRRPRSCRRA